MKNGVTAPPKLSEIKVGIIGLGYVGLPLAVAFARHFPTTGFDIDKGRVSELCSGRDSTLEVDEAELKSSKLKASTDPKCLRGCNFIIVTVPTPIDQVKRPDLGPLFSASRTVGQNLVPGAIVVFESTVYPGATEEDCAPIIENESGLKLNSGFYAGYSPERINPGDKDRTVEKIVKVTSGSTREAAEVIDRVYATVITAGTHLASSIKVAEAAKVIENTQRDLNIALMNELAIIFRKLNIDTTEVLAAAGTKWNFLPFRPGLVGGHCIGIDPYYLTHKAQEIGYNPEVVLAGRRINDSMGTYVAEQVVKLMLRKKISVLDSKILVLGLAFKENCPDLRNSKVVDVIETLREFSAQVEVYDPWVDPEQALKEYGLICASKLPEPGQFDAVVLAVGHSKFIEIGAARLRALGTANSVFYDVKSLFPLGQSDGRL
jgi:UDP-N-acetyl-D-glucosamine/UDP-N-acetyl-D-galactosamine dehydrogenase